MKRLSLYRMIPVVLALVLFNACFGIADAEEAVSIDLSEQHGTVTINKGGVYALSGKLSDGEIVIDASKKDVVELVLSGAEITSRSSAAIYCKQAKELIITIPDGTLNVLQDAENYTFDDPEKEEPNAALFSKADLTIRGDGELRVEGNYKHGISTKDDLKIESCILTVKSISDAIRGKDSITIGNGATFLLNAGKDGIAATNDGDDEKGWISIEDGNISITARGDGVQAKTALTISGGDFDITTDGNVSDVSNSQKGIKAGTILTIDGGKFRFSTQDDAVHSNLDATINGGDFWIVTGDDGVHADRNLKINSGNFSILSCYEGFEGTTIEINGGKVYIEAEDDAIGAAAGIEDLEGFYSRDGNPNIYVRITGGEIEAVSGGDTVDSNGNIFVEGGQLRLSSPAIPYYEGALLCNGRVTVNGGDIAFVGNIGVELTVENQPMLLISHANSHRAGSIVSLRDQAGSVLQEVISRSDFIQSVFSSPDLKIGETYGVYIDDEKLVEVTLTGMINKAADDGGTFTGGYPRGHW